MNTIHRAVFFTATAILLGGLGSVAEAAVGAVEVGKPAVAATPTPVQPAAASKTGAGRTGLDDRIRTTADDAAPVKAGKRTGPGKYQFRCWQYGRLVFEESRDSLLTESPKVLTVSRSQDAGETVQLVDMASTSCVLSVSP